MIMGEEEEEQESAEDDHVFSLFAAFVVVILGSPLLDKCQMILNEWMVILTGRTELTG